MWLRLVGSLKLNVSFAKEPYKREYILQKRLLATVSGHAVSFLERNRLRIFPSPTLEALPPCGGGSAGCPKKGQEESETGE